jgi:hypothetical protein
LFGADVADTTDRDFHPFATAKGAWGRIQRDATQARDPFATVAAMPEIATLGDFFEVGQRAVLVRTTADHGLFFAASDQAFEFAMTARIGAQIDTTNGEICLCMRNPSSEEKETDEKKSSCCVHPLRFLVSLGAEIGDAPTRATGKSLTFCWNPDRGGGRALKQVGPCVFGMPCPERSVRTDEHWNI